MWVCAHTCVGYSCVLMCVYMGVSEGTNAARSFSAVCFRLSIYFII